MIYDFNEIVKHFNFYGKFKEANAYGSGHINDTYAAYFNKPDGNTHRYILQRINTKVFKDPEKLMKNIDSITKHLKNKISLEKGNTERETLNLIPTIGGESFLKTEEGDYWRGYVFVENARTYDVVENKYHLFNAGKAFGKFQKQLCDFPVEKLFETIPDFHDTRKRYSTFIAALENDIVNRAKSVKDEINFVLKRENDTTILLKMQKTGKLPLRVTHNDTKFNNVMIDDETGEGICVIDLDTVMPGLSLFDFGDSIRTGTNTAPEDEKHLENVKLDLELFEYFTRGYLESAKDFLISSELEYLPFAAKLMTFECGMRFLTDYLLGDTYFKIHREGHNIDRCRTQFKMVVDMEEKFEEMKNIVDKCR